MYFNFISGEKYISNTTDNNSTNACNFCEELWMQHALLVVSLAHCFVTLITTGVQCQKCLKCEVEILKTVEPSTSKEKPKTEPKINPYMEVMRNDFSVILLQWIIPILTVLLMCVSADVFKIKKQENKVDDFQMFITEALEHPMNITSNAQYKQDVDNIVSRVYSIIEQVNNNQTFEQAGPKPEDIFSIIEMLDVKTREPKMMKNDEMKEDNFSFKLYTLFFAVFDYLIPLMYSNVMYFKSKMCLKLRQNKTNEKERNDLSLNTNYLKLSIILATVLWTPSFVEFLSRTFLTNEQPNLVTEGLIATGSSYMIARNGINLKAIKNLINQSNNILPIGKS